MVKIFNDLSNANDILNEVLTNDIVGISGSRTAVRQKLKEVYILAERGAYEDVVALSTYDHPDTELAYIYNQKFYDNNKAKQEVIDSYDKK